MGVKPDPEKVRALADVPPPAGTKCALLSNGIIDYLSGPLMELMNATGLIHQIKHDRKVNLMWLVCVQVP